MLILRSVFLSTHATFIAFLFAACSTYTYLPSHVMWLHPRWFGSTTATHPCPSQESDVRTLKLILRASGFDRFWWAQDGSMFRVLLVFLKSQTPRFLVVFLDDLQFLLHLNHVKLLNGRFSEQFQIPGI